SGQLGPVGGRRVCRLEVFPHERDVAAELAENVGQIAERRLRAGADREVVEVAQDGPQTLIEKVPARLGKRAQLRVACTLKTGARVEITNPADGDRSEHG